VGEEIKKRTALTRRYLERRLSDDNVKLSDLLGKDGQAPELRLRRIALSYKPNDGAMKLDSIFYMVQLIISTHTVSHF
jgi:hypothetical protein